MCLEVRDNGSVSWSSSRLGFSSGSAEANGSALECVLDAIRLNKLTYLIKLMPTKVN